MFGGAERHGSGAVPAPSSGGMGVYVPLMIWVIVLMVRLGREEGCE